MKRVNLQWHRWRALAVFGLLLGALSFGIAQTQPPFNERKVRIERNAQDTDDIYVLDLKFKDPRLITVDIPGIKGRKVVWYLWYQVINRTGKPQYFHPVFELVTHDRPHVYYDQILPKVQESIRRIEDPSGVLDIKNSVTIGDEPIPPSLENAYPKAVTGVATWYDIDPDATQFSIFVSGLSNGWSEDDNKVVRRKTLQLKFRKVGDRYLQESREIKFVGPETWLYRATTFKTPELEEKRKEAPAEPKKAAAQESLNNQLPVQR
jgi:hypothetical protein